MIVPEFVTDPVRPRPYIWPSWFTRLLAREDHCWWKAWYKVHHKFTKPQEDRSDFFKERNAIHDKMVKDRADLLIAKGFEVMVEEFASFKLNGKNSDLSGVPDIVAVKGSEALVIDAKSGRHRDSDHWQVLIYILGLKLSWLRTVPPGVEPYIKGWVEYTDGSVEVRPLGPVERDHIVSAIKTIAASEVPEAAPSPSECRYCDVAKCPVRFKQKRAEADASSIF